MVDDVVTVSEAEIVAAMRIVLDDLKLLIEPSSAVPVAALLAGKLGAAAQRIGHRAVRRQRRSRRFAPSCAASA